MLDAEVPPDRDIALGMERCYDVPESVVKFFRWHAEFDRDEGHGFFPEEVFREFPVIDRARARRIVGALRLIIDLYDSFYDGILRYYGAHGVKTRWGLERELTA